MTVRSTQRLIAQIDELTQQTQAVSDEPGVERSSIDFGGSGYGYR